MINSALRLLLLLRMFRVGDAEIILSWPVGEFGEIDEFTLYSLFYVGLV
jgi:hypothetical protein